MDIYHTWFFSKYGAQLQLVWHSVGECILGSVVPVNWSEEQIHAQMNCGSVVKLLFNASAAIKVT